MKEPKERFSKLERAFKILEYLKKIIQTANIP